MKLRLLPIIPLFAASAACAQTSAGVDHVCLASNLGIGYNTGMATYGEHSAQTSGLRLQGGLGAAFPLRSNYGNKFVTATLDIISIRAQNSIKNDVPTATNNDYSLLYFGVPVAFNSVSYGSGRGTGFYWQVGSYFSVNASAKDGGKDISSAVNKVGVEPFAGFGLAKLFEARDRITGNDHTVNLLLGPFISYNVINVLATSGNTFRYLSFGITCTTMRLD